MGRCFLCGRWGATERHHIFGGALRKKSDAYHLTVDLCHDCHNEPGGAHYDRAVMQHLHEYGQRKAMEENGWTVEEFRQEFYKNYL